MQRELLSRETTQDFPGTKYKITYEPGDHIKTDQEFQYLLEAVCSGNLNASIWNPAVSARLGTYHPRVLGLDTGIPSLGNLSIERKVLMWITLPCRPGGINEDGIVYMVNGDLCYSLSITDIAHPLTDQVKKELLALDLAGGSGHDMSRLVLPSISGLVMGAMLLSFFKKIKEERRFPVRVDRRRFLLMLAGTAAVATMLPISVLECFFPDFAARSTQPETKDFLVRLNQLTSFWTSPNACNARSAIVLAKTQDAMSQMNLPEETPAAAIFGYAHIRSMGRLQESYQERQRVIEMFTRNLLSEVDSILKEFPTFPREETINRLLKYITLTEIMKATDPGGPDANPDFINELDRCLVQEATFHSPQVRAAIEPLRKEFI